MGRPPKYASPEERAAAHRAQKSAWYHDRNKLISDRRRRARTRIKFVSASQNSGIKAVDEYEGSWTTRHIQHIRSALLQAPDANLVEEACAFWRLVFESFTRGDLRSWNMELLELLLKTPDDDSATFSECTTLSEELDRLGDVGSGLLRAAFALDPSGNGWLYAEASSLERYMRKLSSSVGEMSLLRHDGRHVLKESQCDGSLICHSM